nr:hypothetical protein [uncultured Rhodopila sp.]
MFSLFALQIALTQLWMRSFTDPEVFNPFGYGRSRVEEKAAADAMRELERIVLAHSAERRERMT